MATAVVPVDARCLDCNYSLRGLTELRCPECGRPFDPAQPLTMNLGLPLDAFARRALAPMGRGPRYAMWALVVVGVFGPAWLLPSGIVACLWLLLWVAFFFACWLRTLLRAAVLRRYQQPRGRAALDRRFRRTVRIAFVVATLIVLTRLPLLLAILVSRPWLDRYAYHLWAEVPASVPAPTGPVRVGILCFREVFAGGETVEFNFYGTGGVAYQRTEDGRHLRLVWWAWNPHWRNFFG